MCSEMAKEARRRIDRANQTGIDFLIADLNVGLTYLQIADSTCSAATRARNLEKALQVYRTVVRHLPQVVLSPDDHAEISNKLHELRLRLGEP
jgi:hypothetical protein